MIDWAEEARRRLGPGGKLDPDALVEPDPDAFGKGEGGDEENLHFFASGNRLSKLKPPPSLQKVHPLPPASGEVEHEVGVDEVSKPEKTDDSENRAVKTDETPDGAIERDKSELSKLTKPPFDDLLLSIANARPLDVREEPWQFAMHGLRKFIASGDADKALALGWPPAELFKVPKLWSQISETGAALLIGDREVVNVSPSEIRIKNNNTGSTLAFYRKPAIDYRVAYEAHLKLSRGNYPADSEEPRLRALESTVRLYRDNTGADLETAAAAVRAAISKGKQQGDG